MQRGLHSQQLARYFERFPQEALLVLIFEELLQDPASQLDRLAAFLGLEAGWSHPHGLTREPVNVSEIPRFRAAFARAQRLGEIFTRNDLDWVVRLARRCGIARAFGTLRSRPPLCSALRVELEKYCLEDIKRLERLLGRGLDVWLSTMSAPATHRGFDTFARSWGTDP